MIAKNLFFYFSMCFFGFLAEFVISYIVVIFTQAITGSSTLVGLNFFLLFLPYILFSLFAGVIADKYPRKRILFIAQSFAILFFISIYYLVSNELITTVQFFPFSILIFLYGVAFSFIPSSDTALLGQVVDKKNIEKGSLIVSVMVMLAFCLNPILTSFVKEITSWANLFLLPAGLLVVSNIFLLLIRVEKQVPIEEKSIFLLLKDGVGLVKNSNLLRAVFLFTFVQAFFIIGPGQVVIPQFCTEILNLSEIMRGYIMSSIGVGLLTGSIIMAIKEKIEDRVSLIIIMLLATSIFSCFIVFSVSFWSAFIILFITGVFAGISDSLLLSSIQLNAPEDKRARVLSLYFFIGIALPSLGGLLSGFLVDLLSLKISLMLMGLISSMFFLFQSIRRRYI